MLYLTLMSYPCLVFSAENEGIQALRKDNLETAKRYFATHCEPQHAVCQNDWAVALIIEGKYKEASEKLTSLLTGEEIPRAAFRNLALCYYFLGNYDLSEKYYQQALAHGDRLARAGLAYLYLEQNRLGEAARLLTSKADHATEEEWLQLYRGLLSLKLREYDKAERQFGSVLAKNPNNFDAYLYRAQARYYRQLYRETIEDLNIADRLIPGNQETRPWRLRVQQKNPGN